MVRGGDKSTKAAHSVESSEYVESATFRRMTQVSGIAQSPHFAVIKASAGSARRRGARPPWDIQSNRPGDFQATLRCRRPAGWGTSSHNPGTTTRGTRD